VTFTLEELANSDLLGGVATDTLKRIAAEGDALVLHPGDCLLRPEVDNHHIFIVLSGELTVHLGSQDAPPIRRAGTGEAVGELSVIDGNPPTACVVAAQNSRVFRIHRDMINRMIGDDCPLARNLLLVLARLVKASTVRMGEDQSHIHILTNHANLDDLTGLYNRRWLDSVVDDLLELGQPLCVMVLDVDHFKEYNDCHGHPAGDCALATLAATLKATVRPSDCLVRYGGEEFLILLPNTHRIDAIAIAERIRTNIENADVRDPLGAALPSITASIGLTVSTPDERFDNLIVSADNQLYRAKAEGRNRVCA
jgi:diguanylate cyclase (GGDEF)-like protein